jgi:glycosyltransferase involved in cell wall biosynthesis
VHDVIWHKEVFEDDQEAVKWLLNKVDGAVYLNDHSKKNVKPHANRVPSRVIPEGPIESKSDTSRAEMRQRLGVPDQNKLLVLLGYLQDYKGVDLLISGAYQVPQNISIRIAGVCDPDFHERLKELLKRSELVNVDIELREGFLSDADYSAYLEAADYFIYPCRDINNSGSLNSALSAGVPVIVPNIQELDWIIQECKIVIEKDLNGEFNFEQLYSELVSLNESRYAQLVMGAQKWKRERSWSQCAEAYQSLYREILDA